MLFKDRFRIFAVLSSLTEAGRGRSAGGGLVRPGASSAGVVLARREPMLDSERPMVSPSETVSKR